MRCHVNCWISGIGIIFRIFYAYNIIGMYCIDVVAHNSHNTLYIRQELSYGNTLRHKLLQVRVQQGYNNSSISYTPLGLTFFTPKSIQTCILYVQPLARRLFLCCIYMLYNCRDVIGEGGEDPFNLLPP